VNLAFLVDGQNHRMGGWSHVEADHVLNLFGKGRIARTLEGAHPVRLQAVALPDPLNGAKRDPNPLGHSASGPVCDLAGSEQFSASMAATVLVECGGVPGGRVLSRSSPSVSASPYRCCQRQSAGRLTPARRATSCTDRRSTDSRTMRAAGCASTDENDRRRSRSTAPSRSRRG
jgi:hypothetical protein